MVAGRVNLWRVVASVGCGVTATTMLFSAMLILDFLAGPNTSAYHLLSDWLLGWPEQLLSADLLGRGVGGREGVMALWDVLLYSSLANVILQHVTAGRRLSLP